ncbi:MAG: hypothetical protein OXG58_09415 [Gemmatimonadetes bacterium]|nr:hypothetical protein [Gemmatimonadota bacterium]MCY3943777.1 hypothetical protein [Gemmatimonadota bacterium]
MRTGDPGAVTLTRAPSSVTRSWGLRIESGYGANPPVAKSYLLYWTTTVPPRLAKSRSAWLAAASSGRVS